MFPAGEVLLKIDRADGSLSMNYDFSKAGSLQIVGYQASGLVANAPLFLTFLDLPDSKMITGTSNPTLLPTSGSAFPLFFDSIPDSTIQLNVPITVITGDNQMPATHMWKYKVTDLFNNPATFTFLTVRMIYIPCERRWPHLNGNEIKTREAKELVERNQMLDARGRDHSQIFSRFDYQ